MNQEPKTPSKGIPELRKMTDKLTSLLNSPEGATFADIYIVLGNAYIAGLKHGGRIVKNACKTDTKKVV